MNRADNDKFTVAKTDAANNDLLLFKRLVWREVCESAPPLSQVDDAAQYEHPCTLVELLDSKFLSTVLDDSYSMWPLWFVKLPGQLWPHAHELAMRFPCSINRESDDLLHKHTYYCSFVLPNDSCTDSAGDIMNRSVGYVFFSGFVESSITRACEVGGINLLLRAGSNAVLASYALDEDEILSLQGAGSSAGPNWRPYRIYEKEEMAAVASRGAGGNAYVLGTLPAGQHSCAVIPFGHSGTNGEWWRTD